MALLHTRTVLILAAAFACSPLYAERTPLDRQLPVTAVEERACRHMLSAAPHGEQTDIWFNPFTLEGFAPEPGQQISGVLFPKTPLFDFYFAWQRLFTADYPISFPKEIDCLVRSYVVDGKITWTNIPDGDYYVAIMSQRSQTRAATSGQTTTTYDGAGNAVLSNTISGSPQKTYTLTHIVHIAVTTKGGKLMMAPQWVEAR